LSSLYELECTDCGFRERIVGEFADAIEAASAHRADRNAAPDGHFVNVHRRS